MSWRYFIVAVAGIQETKWFRSDAAKGCTLLRSGRPTPKVSKGKGVGIVMSNRATAAWRAAGEEQFKIGDG